MVGTERAHQTKKEKDDLRTLKMVSRELGGGNGVTLASSELVQPLLYKPNDLNLKARTPGREKTHS